MQARPRVVPASRDATARPGFFGSLGPAVAGLAWLGIAVASAWLVFATPMLGRLITPGPQGSATPVVGAVAWAVALTAPACFAVLGLARVGAAVHRWRAGTSALPPVARLADRLPAGCTVIARICLPDGRRIPDVVVGPHGVAFFERLPPPAATRHTGDRWEVRLSDRWRPIENPFHRAARDGERLRRHLEAEERDFVVRVHAAVIGPRGELERGDGCAVVAIDDVPAWLAALPAQRGLTPDRLAHLGEILEALA